jgi:hypothetical protein
MTRTRRPPFSPTRLGTVGYALLLVGAGACLRSPLDAGQASSGLGEPEDTTGEEGSSTNSPSPTTSSSDTGPVPTDTSGTTGPSPSPIEKLDLLFVIDNSAGTATEQRRLARALQVVGDFLEFEVADWRVAVTTTDNGNPWCGGTTPEAGAFVNRSCVDRLGDFIDQTGSLDASDRACLDLCPFTSAQMGLSGAWVGKANGQSNYSGAFTASEVLPCIVPQGINGCGFESHLESLYKSELRTRTESDPAFGFFREDAAKGIVILTDEVDCSYDAQWSSIFTQDGGKVFWQDPSASYPTSALCWNAGVRCTGGAFGEFSCQPQDKNVFGELLEPGFDDEAVLHTLTRYEGKLQALEDQVQALYPQSELGIALLAGYGFDNEPRYPLAEDPVFENDFGIGAGCSFEAPGLTTCVTDAQCGVIGLGPCEDGFCLEEESAISPVRMQALVGSFDDGTSLRYSSCHEDYSDPLLDFVVKLAFG